MNAKTYNPAGSPRVTDMTPRMLDPGSVSLAPLDPITALKGLLATEPPAEDKER